MNQLTYNLWSIILSAFGLIVTTGALWAVYIQIKKLKEAAYSNTHNMLCNQSFELLKFFSDHPETYDYFYHKKELTDDADNKAIILYTTEALVNFLEHLILQKHNLPHKQWKVWEKFIYTSLQYSVVVEKFIQDNREWYSPDLLRIADGLSACHENITT